MPYVLGPTQYMLLYKGGSGQAKVMSITGSGNDLTLTAVWSDTWSAGWSHLVAIAHEGTRRLFAYRSSTGHHELDVVHAPAASGRLRRAVPLRWRHGQRPGAPVECRRHRLFVHLVGELDDGLALKHRRSTKGSGILR